MYIILMSLICLSALIYIFLNHPLSFGMILLMQTILISTFTGLMNYNFWFSYILFLIMVGGMLILFIYMTSIASNEKFKFSFKLMMLVLLTLSISMILFIADSYYSSLNLNMMEIINQNNSKNNYFSMNKYLNYPQNIILYMKILYLFITLIMIAKITNINYGPLRQKF